MTYNEITEIINTKLKQNTTILKNGEIYCYVESDYIDTQISATIYPFEGDLPEFDVTLEEYCTGIHHMQGFDNIDKFVIEFKKIIDAISYIDDLLSRLVIF